MQRIRDYELLSSQKDIYIIPRHLKPKEHVGRDGRKILRAEKVYDCCEVVFVGDDGAMAHLNSQQL